MKLLSPSTCSTFLLAGLIGMATASPVNASLGTASLANASLANGSLATARTWCWRQTSQYHLGKEWRIRIHPFPAEKVGDLCHRFWENLKGHWLCTVYSPHGCQPWYWDGKHGHEPGEGIRWQFTTTTLCNEGMVESAFWGATKNEYGAIDCDD